MKFSHRVAILSLIGALTLIFAVLTLSGNIKHLMPARQESLRSFLSKHKILSGFKSILTSTNTCQSKTEESPGVISTLDLQKKTDFNTYTNGQYNIPHPELEDAAYGKDIKPLNVIILPHSHVDPGWIETLDDYYIQKVKNILNNMVKKLHLYQDMTFIWAEVVFFSRWYEELSEVLQDQVRLLIESGRLELVLGGWVMPDEASTHYVSVIDQLVEGHQWLLEFLNVRPNNSWSIDPFGHSATMPYLWKKAGMKNMVIQRIHQATKGALVKQAGLEFYWKQYWDHAGMDNILCHVNPYMLYSLHHTCGPEVFTCAMFDFLSLANQPFQRHVKPIDDNNILRMSQALYEQYRLKGGLFKYNTILVPLGDDFRYDSAAEWDNQYENYKKLMKFMNAKKEWKINVKFGTVNDYFQLIIKEQQKSSIKFPTLSGDFFPYSDKNSVYWTGYYSTRPFDKRFSREVESRLRAAEVLNSLMVAYSKQWKKESLRMKDNAAKLREARRNLGLFLHHDAITGTATFHVVQDYEKRLYKSFENAQIAMQVAVQFLLTQGKLDSDPILYPELVRDDPRVSSLHQTIIMSEEGTRVVLFNPTAGYRSEFVEFIVNSPDIEVKNSKRQSIPFQINPVFSSATEVSSSSFEIVFLAEIPPLSIETFIFRKVLKNDKRYWAKITLYNTNELIVPPELLFEQEKPSYIYVDKLISIENEYINAEFSYKGTLLKMTDKISKSTTTVHLEFKQYTSRGSGAYIFFPADQASEITQNNPIVRVIEGPFTSEVQAVFLFIFHKTRLYNHLGVQGRALFVQNALDMHILNLRDKEVIMRLGTNLKNINGSFFTDENGFQMIGRKTNKIRPIGTNFYPVSTMGMLEDGKTRLTLHTGQAHGIASLEQGWLEVMLDRQLLYDDERGLGEGIFDNKLTMTKFCIQIEQKQTETYQDKFIYPSLTSILINENLQQPIQKMFSPINTDVMGLNFHSTLKPLPCHISLISLKTLYNRENVYRGTSLILHNKGYQCGFSNHGLQCPTDKIDLTALLPGVVSANETSLTHTQTLETDIDLENIDIPPMELKSFLLRVKP